MTDRIALIRDRLTAAFSPTKLDIIDDSHKHAGHAGARHGGHFTVTITSEAFAGKKLLQRHRLVYDALADAMQGGEIHALSIRAHTPQETFQKPAEFRGS